MTLSVAIVCKNNEATIGRTLESVSGLASEIVAVDSGSTDTTLDLLQKHNARIIETEWKGHVATKQMALEACTSDWILCLDSDESVEPDLQASIRDALAAASPSADGFEVNRKVFYKNKFLDHAWQPEWRLRLVRAGTARWGGRDPHDALALTAPARPARLQGTLRHDSFATFAEHFAKQVALSRIAAQSLHTDGKRGSYLRLMTSPTGALLKQLVLKQAWRDGLPGWLAAATTSGGALMKHAMLLELARATETDTSPD